MGYGPVYGLFIRPLPLLFRLKIFSERPFCRRNIFDERNASAYLFCAHSDAHGHASFKKNAHPVPKGGISDSALRCSYFFFRLNIYLIFQINVILILCFAKAIIE